MALRRRCTTRRGSRASLSPRSCSATPRRSPCSTRRSTRDSRPAAHAYAGPHEWLARGLRRYGFHGINHEYAAHRAAHLLDRPLDELRLITCHLGSGCSLAASAAAIASIPRWASRRSRASVMGTRSGSLDPGLLLHLLREEGASVDGLDRVLQPRLRAAGALGSLRRPPRRARRAATAATSARALAVGRLHPSPALPPRRHARRPRRAGRRGVHRGGRRALRRNSRGGASAIRVPGRATR